MTPEERQQALNLALWIIAIGLAVGTVSAAFLLRHRSEWMAVILVPAVLVLPFVVSFLVRGWLNNDD